MAFDSRKFDDEFFGADEAPSGIAGIEAGSPQKTPSRFDEAGFDQEFFGADNVPETPRTKEQSRAQALRRTVQLPEEDIAVPPPVGEEGFMGGIDEVGRGLARTAMVRIPEMTGKAAEYFDPEGGSTAMRDWGIETQENAKQWLQGNPEYKQSLTARAKKQADAFSVHGSAGEAAEMIGPSVAPPLVGAGLGALVGGGIGALGGFGVGAVPGAALGAKAGAWLGTAGMLAGFFGSAAQETEDKVYKANNERLLKEGVPKTAAHEQAMEIAKPAGLKAGAGESIGEGLSMFPLFKVLRLLPNSVKKNAVKAATSVMRKPGALFTDLLKVIGAEVSTEIVQTVWQQYVEAEAGAGEMPNWDSTKGVIMPTILMSVALMGMAEPIGMAQRKKLAGTLADANASPEQRMDAVRAVAGEIKDPALQKMWMEHSVRQIQVGAPIVSEEDVFYSEEAARVLSEQQGAPGGTPPSAPGAAPAGLADIGLPPVSTEGIIVEELEAENIEARPLQTGIDVEDTGPIPVENIVLSSQETETRGLREALEDMEARQLPVPSGTLAVTPEGVAGQQAELDRAVADRVERRGVLGITSGSEREARKRAQSGDTDAAVRRKKDRTPITTTKSGKPIKSRRAAMAVRRNRNKPNWEIQKNEDGTFEIHPPRAPEAAQEDIPAVPPETEEVTSAEKQEATPEKPSPRAGVPIPAPAAETREREPAGEPVSGAFTPTHILRDGTPVVSAGEADVWRDRNNNEWEEENVTKIQAEDRRKADEPEFEKGPAVSTQGRAGESGDVSGREHGDGGAGERPSKQEGRDEAGVGAPREDNRAVESAAGTQRERQRGAEGAVDGRAGTGGQDVGGGAGVKSDVQPPTDTRTEKAGGEAAPDNLAGKTESKRAKTGSSATPKAKTPPVSTEPATAPNVEASDAERTKQARLLKRANAIGTAYKEAIGDKAAVANIKTRIRRLARKVEDGTPAAMRLDILFTRIGMRGELKWAEPTTELTPVSSSTTKQEKQPSAKSKTPKTEEKAEAGEAGEVTPRTTTKFKNRYRNENEFEVFNRDTGKETRVILYDDGTFRTRWPEDAGLTEEQAAAAARAEADRRGMNLGKAMPAGLDFGEAVGYAETKGLSMADAFELEAFLPNGAKGTHTKVQIRRAISEMHKKGKAATAKKAKDAAMAGNNGKALGLELKHPDRDQWALILPDSSEEGKYRSQRFDKSGFFSHSTVETPEAALDELVADGFTEPDMGALDRLAATDEWAEGSARTADVQRMNRESWERSEAEKAEITTPAHPPTQAAASEALVESAENTPLDLSEARKWLLAEIDKRITRAPSYKDKKFNKVVSEGVDEKKPWTSVPLQVIAGTTTIDVPGDGKFTLVNIKERLRDFRGKVSKSTGFNETQRKRSLGRRGGSITATIKEFETSNNPDDIRNAIELRRLRGEDVTKLEARLPGIDEAWDDRTRSSAGWRVPIAGDAVVSTRGRGIVSKTKKGLIVGPGGMDRGANGQVLLAGDWRVEGDTADKSKFVKPAPAKAELPRAPRVSASDIPQDLAHAAHAGSSMVPEKRAEQERQGYISEMNDAYAQMRKAAEAGGTLDQLDSEFTSYKGGYLKRKRALLGAESRTLSSMVTGPSNFPTRRNQKALDTAQKRREELLEYADKALARAKRNLRPDLAPIKSGESGTLAKLKAKLSTLEDSQEKMKAGNKIVRSKKLSAEEKARKLKDLGFSEALVKETLTPDSMGRVGFPAYLLSNNRANITRLKERVTTEEKRAVTTEDVTIKFEGGSVELDYGANRLRIHHDEKPSADVRGELKANGFRWSPKAGAWQRQLTDNAKMAATRVVGVSFDTPKPSYAGTKAATANKHALARAVQMEREGATNEEIRKETGWAVGLDDKWRFELSDEDMSLKENPKSQPGRRGTPPHWKLGDLIDHPTLFEAYPELLDVKVETSARGSWYNPKTDTIGVTNVGEAKRLDALVHEISHRIAALEGFARGGSVKEFQPGLLSKTVDPGKALRLSKTLYRERYEGKRQQDFPDTEGNVFRLVSLAAKEGDRKKALEYARQAIPIDKYRRLAGEIEARDAALRRLLTDKQRSDLEPYVAQGVSKEDAIVAYGNARGNMRHQARAAKQRAKHADLGPQHEALAELRKQLSDEFGKARIARMEKNGTLKLHYLAGEMPGGGKYSDAQGIYLDGVVHLNAENTSNAVEGLAAAVLSHEGTHASEKGKGRTKEVLGVGFDNFHGQLSALRDKGDEAAVSAFERVPGDTPAADRASEEVAYFVEEAYQRIQAGKGGTLSARARRLYRQIVAAAKAWYMNTSMGKGANFRITDELAVALVKQSIGRAGAARRGRSGRSEARTFPKFYSELTRQIQKLNQPKAARGQWLGMIRNLPQKGVKQAEIDWSGVQGWLREQEGPVTKGQLLDYLKSQEVDVEEVTLSNAVGEYDSSVDEAARETFESEFNAEDSDWSEWMADTVSEEVEGAWNDPSHRIWARLGADKAYYRDQFRDEEGVLDEAGKNGAEWQFQDDAKELGWEALFENEALNDFREEAWDNTQQTYIDAENSNREDAEVEMGGDPDSDDSAKYAEYQMPGERENYRELLLMLPYLEGEPYKGPHFDEEDVVVHLRFNEREIGGKKTMFVEEVQSDWAQEGRKKGYDSTPRWELEGRNGDVIGVFATLDEAQDAAKRHNRPGHFIRQIKPTGVPSIPFKQTNQWALLGMKRAIRWASENNFEQVAWTPGEVQTERYRSALRKGVDRVAWTKEKDGIRLVGTKGGRQVIDTTEAESALSDAIGKAMGDKIISDPNQSGVLEGDDITISDTGMAGFYDKILPKAVGKFIKKFGSKVGVSQVGGQDVWTFPVTDKMQKSAMEGMPLFSRKPAPDIRYSRAKPLPATIEVAGVARPTTNSEGKPIHPTEEGVRNFWGWFKNSRVVDAEGRPLVVYHGTAADIGSFNREFGGWVTDAESAKKGFFFSSSQMTASDYAEYADQGTGNAELLDLWQKVHNALSGRLAHKMGSKGYNDALAEAATYKPKIAEIIKTSPGHVVYPVYLKTDNPVIKDQDGKSFRGETYSKLIDVAMESGKDGAIIKNTIDNEIDEVEDIYVVFDPTQIKSAIGNTGAFSPTSPDIRYSRAKPLPATIEVAGVARPTTNSEGKPIHPTEEGVRNFWGWFGGSAVVDAEGRPVPQYHWSDSEFTEFDMRLSGEGAHFGTAQAAEDRARGMDRIEYEIEEDEGDFFVFADTGPTEGEGLGPFPSERDAKAFVVKQPKTIPPTAAYLRMENPIRLSDLGTWGDWSIISSLPEGTISDKESDAIMSADDRYGALRATLLKRGVDGFVYQNEMEDKGSDSYIAFFPTQIKSATDNVGTFSPTDPDIRYSRAKKGATAGKRAPSTTFDLPEKSDLTDTLLYHIHDKFRSLYKVQRELGELPEEQDAYLAETQYHGKARARMDKLHKERIEPLLQVMADGNLTVEQVDEFLYARHAPEANARLRRINARRHLKDLISAKENGQEANRIQKEMDAIHKELKNDPAKLRDEYLDLLNAELTNVASAEEQAVADRWAAFSEKPSGMTDKESADIRHRTGGNTALQDVGSKVDAMTAARVDALEQDGLLTPEEAAAWRGAYKHYVPLKREGFDDRMPGKGKGKSVGGREAKVRGGSTRRAVDLLANTVAQSEISLIRGDKMRVGRALYEMVKAKPHESFWSVDEDKKQAGYDDYGNVVMYPDAREYDNQVKVKIDGVQHTIEFDETNDHAMRIAKAVKNLDNQAGPIINALSRVNRFLSFVNTSASPEFMISNALRDIQTAAYNLSDTDADALRGKILKSVPKAIKGIHKAIRGDGKSEWAKWYRDFEEHGGKVGWMDNYESIEDRRKKLQNEVKRLKGHTPRKVFHDVMQFIEDYNAIVENGVRLSAYKNAVESGMSKNKAAQLAKELTVNFNRKGASGQVINSLYLFANAGIQGSMRILRGMKYSPKLRRMAYATIGAAVVLDMVNRAMGGDDDDGEALYDKIEDHVKERNMIFMHPDGSGDYFKIPLPWGYNVLWVIGNSIGSAADGARGANPEYKTMESGWNVISAFLGAFNPLQAGTPLQTLAPTVADPLVQIAENKSWSGNPLKPEHSPYDKTPKPEYQMFWSSSRPVSQAIAKVLNDLSGGDEVEPGAMNISPEWLDVAWDSITGSAGRFLADSIGTPLKAVTGEDIKAREIPFVRRLAGGKSEFANSGLYRERSREVLTAREQLKHYRGDPKKLAEVRRDKAGLLKLRGLTAISEKRLRVLRKRLKRARTDAARDRIKWLMRQIHTRFNARYRVVVLQQW